MRSSNVAVWSKKDIEQEAEVAACPFCIKPNGNKVEPAIFYYLERIQQTFVTNDDVRDPETKVRLKAIRA